jgi:hypothetical protein
MNVQVVGYAAGKKDPMPKWARVLIGFGIAAVVAGIYLWFFGVQTGMTLIARYKFGAIPGVWRSPVALTDLSVSNVSHKKVSYFGYEIELPWDDVDEQREKVGRAIHVAYFHSGNAFWFSIFPPKEFVNGLMKEGKLDPAALRQLFGDKTLQSDYGFYQAMLGVTPKDISPFMPRNRAAAESMLLLIKAIAIPRAESGIFSIQTPDFHGFQFENPKERPFRITDELYSNDGGIDLIFMLKLDGTAPSISQAEINRVIRSIRKNPDIASTADLLHRSIR